MCSREEGLSERVSGGAAAHPPASLQISVRQGMRADPGALAALCEKTDNDIRACINTLQVRRCVGGCCWGATGLSRLSSAPAPLSSFFMGGAGGS